jgi:hypothetical protein
MCKSGFDPAIGPREVCSGQVAVFVSEDFGFPFSIIPPMISTHTPFIWHRRHVNLEIYSFVKQKTAQFSQNFKAFAHTRC